MQGKQPGPCHLLKKPIWNVLSCSDLQREERDIDIAFIELTMMPIKLFEMQIERSDNQIMVGPFIMHI